MSHSEERPPIAGEADRERPARIAAEGVTWEWRTRSGRRVDGGRSPIEESPLFGGARQGNLFDE